MASATDVNPIQNIELIEPVSEKQKKKEKAQDMAAQVAALVDRMDRQAARTDRLIDLMDTRLDRAPPKQHAPPHKVVETSLNSPPGSGGRFNKKKVCGSRLKKHSPKGRVKGRARHSTTQSEIVWSASSSDSDSYSTQAQVRTALDMLNPRFTKHRGNIAKQDERVQRYRPFAYLDRERQRSIARHSHPDELNLNQHLGGLCAMALEELDPSNPATGIIQHIGQILEDIEFIPWCNVRAFSNTVISNVAKNRWWWAQDRRIEQCRTNQYMRYKANDEPQWSVPCPAYNKGRCNHNEPHCVGEVYMKHVCAFCNNFAQENGHPSRSCNRKKYNNATGQGASSNPDRKEYRQNRSYKGDRPDDSANK